MMGGSTKCGKLRWLAVLMLLLAVSLSAGCAPAPPDNNTPDDATVLTEAERLAATRAVYDSYLALSTQELAAKEEAACRRQLFENIRQARWDIAPYEDAPDYWSTTLFFWLRDFSLDEGTELPYLLLPYGSTDGAYSEAYSGALACQFMAHPHALLKLITACGEEDKGYYAGCISYGAYPHEEELRALLEYLAEDSSLSKTEQQFVALTLLRLERLHQ